jgi:5-methylcytosine-specific restriction endonuclease McrA
LATRFERRIIYRPASEAAAVETRTPFALFGEGTMLDGNVLVLNRVFQAVQITSVRRAFTLLYKGQVRAVDSEYRTYDFDNWADIPVQPSDHYVTTPTRIILIPHVVQLLLFDRLPRQEVKFSRGNIYLRDHNRCQYCGRKFPASELSLDHVVPISRGGKSTWENVVCSCLPCNVRKGNKLLNESEIRLIRQPLRPKWHPLHRLQGRSSFPDIWKNFLDEAYWNVELKS